MKTFQNNTDSRRDSKGVAYYLSLPYIVEITPISQEDGGGFAASIPLLGRYTAVGDGETPQEAYADLREALPALLEEFLAEKVVIPEPSEEAAALPSGKLSVRLSRTLHARVKEQAKADGVSVNEYIATTLAQTVIGDANVSRLSMQISRLERLADTHASVPGRIANAISSRYGESLLVQAEPLRFDTQERVPHPQGGRSRAA